MPVPASDHHRCKDFFFLRFNWDFPYYNMCVPSPPFTDHIWEKSCSCSLWPPIRWREGHLDSPFVTSKKNKLSSPSLFSCIVYSSVQIFKFCILKVLQEWAELVSRKQHGISKHRLKDIQIKEENSRASASSRCYCY